MDFTQELNSSQLAAVMHTEGPALVIAGAGSGKTRVLTYRIAQLLSQGIPPYRILALTFTNKAAREMQRRIATLVGEGQAASLWMGTFHSVFAGILRVEAEHLGYTREFTIYDAQDSKNLIKQIIKDLNLGDKTYVPNDVLGRISAAKNALVSAQAYANSDNIQEGDRAASKSRLHEIYRIYETRCKRNNVMDFDDLLFQTNVLFRDFPDILEKYQHKFGHILVDEYQDTNYSQYLIIKKLAAHHHNICVVGDDAQSIYSFRGARIENILNFKNDYPDYTLYKLEQNYRSTTTIVNAANSVIARNKEQIPKQLYSRNEEGEKIKIIKAFTDREEGVEVAHEIYRIARNKCCNYDQFAVLYRTNAQSRLIEEALRKQNIPYKIYGGTSFYQRKEIKDTIAYLRLAVNHQDEESLRRVINYPRRGIGDATVARIQEEADRQLVNTWTLLADAKTLATILPPGTVTKITRFVNLIREFSDIATRENAHHAAHFIIKASGIIDELAPDDTPEGTSRKENVQELLDAVKAFTENAIKEQQPPLITRFLQEIALLTDQDKDESDNIPKVTLMTVHSAKGLEFATVCLVGMEEDLFPSPRSIHESTTLEEERRLFYVAMTRAEKRLIISHATTRYRNGQVTTPPPSRFIGEIDPSHLRGERPRIPIVNSQNPIARVPMPTPVQSRETRDVDTAHLRLATPDDLKPGKTIHHPRFGNGQIIHVEGTGDNRKVKIHFPQHGMKLLLLKFAKLYTQKE